MGPDNKNGGEFSAFKTCKPCGMAWSTREKFLSDPSIEIIGYQADFRELVSGAFLFNHSCQATLALPVRKFNGLYEGQVFEKRATGTDECPGYCLHQSELRPCPASCECAYVRNIIQIIKNWPKTAID